MVWDPVVKNVWPFPSSPALPCTSLAPRPRLALSVNGVRAPRLGRSSWVITAQNPTNDVINAPSRRTAVSYLLPQHATLPTPCTLVMHTPDLGFW